MRPQLLKNILHRQRERQVPDLISRNALRLTTATLNEEYDDLNEECSDLMSITRDEYIVHRADYKNRVHQYNINVMMHKHRCMESDLDTDVQFSSAFDEVENRFHDYDTDEEETFHRDDEDNEEECNDLNENGECTCFSHDDSSYRIVNFRNMTTLE